MSNKFYWSSDPADKATSFDLNKSVDGGATYTSLVNVPYDVNGVNYDRQQKKFFYTDVSGNAGDIYHVVSNGPLGASDPLIVVAPPTEAPTCTIVGYVRDPFGYVDTRMAVHVESAGKGSERWVAAGNGTIGQNAQSLAIVDRSIIVNPNSDGMWSVDLIQRSVMRIMIPALEFNVTFEVPARIGPINVKDLRPLSGQTLGEGAPYAGDRLYLPES